MHVLKISATRLLRDSGERVLTFENIGTLKPTF
jgi:hypothetical protein